MPHTPSAEKRMRKSEKRRKHNRTVAKVLKGKRREIAELLVGKDPAKTAETLKVVQATLDRAATKGYIHANKAARLKSRLVKRQRAAAAK
jgi:small subunit ribosomal protein S20